MQHEMTAEIPYGLALSGEYGGTPCNVVLTGSTTHRNVEIESFTAQGIAVHVGERIHFYPWHRVACITYDEPM